MLKTLIDLSDNRQVTKRQNSTLNLPGLTVFGQTDDQLITGPDLDTIRVLVPEVDNVTTTFTGNTQTSIYEYSFGVEDMGEGENLIEHFDLTSDVGSQQSIGPVWVGKDPVSVGDGKTMFKRYEGIQYDLTLANIEDLGDGNVSGSIRSTYQVLETDALDYNGDYLWVDVRGKTKTKQLIIENVGTGPSTIDLGADANGNVVNVASDIRLKENISSIPDALNKVLGLEGITYNWKDRNAGGDNNRIGFIAQQVKDVVPELVYESKNDGLLGVHYNNTAPLLVEAIKELNNTVNNIQSTPNETTLEVEKIFSEDNQIQLNYGGNKETALNGGIILSHAISQNKHSTIKTNENGDWELFPNISLKKFTPENSYDTSGFEGNVSFDDNYLYIKTDSIWKRTNLEAF